MNRHTFEAGRSRLLNGRPDARMIHSCHDTATHARARPKHLLGTVPKSCSEFGGGWVATVPKGCSEFGEGVVAQPKHPLGTVPKGCSEFGGRG